MIILDILKYVGIAFFIRLGFVIYEGWKMSGQKPVDMCFSDDGKKKPWDDALNKKYGNK